MTVPKIPAKPPKHLRPYLAHGVDLQWDEGDEEAVAAECPWCGREGKFSVRIETGQWRCYVCDEGTAGKKGYRGGNAYTFLRLLWDKSDAATTDYSALATARGLRPDTLMRWGVCRSILTGDWLMPGHGPDGKLNQLYRYVRKDDRMILLATSTLGHQLIGVPLLDASCSTVYFCESWDALRLWEALGQIKLGKDGLALTANVGRSLLATAGVLGVPACSVFEPGWATLAAGKDVCLVYDNDHPRVHPRTGQPVLPAALSSMERVVGLLVGAKKSPASIRIQGWGSEMLYNLSKPDGYDVSDALEERKGNE